MLAPFLSPIVGPRRAAICLLKLRVSPPRSNQSAANVEPMMFQSDDVSVAPRLDFEGWRELVRSMCGRYNPAGTEPSAFTGWARRVNVCGFTAVDFCCNAGRIERTYHDTRLDGVDHYVVFFPVAGRSAMIHNDQSVELAVGDVALVDAAR